MISILLPVELLIIGSFALFFLFIILLLIFNNHKRNVEIMNYQLDEDYEIEIKINFNEINKTISLFYLSNNKTYEYNYEKYRQTILPSELEKWDNMISSASLNIGSIFRINHIKDLVTNSHGVSREYTIMNSFDLKSRIYLKAIRIDNIEMIESKLSDIAELPKILPTNNTKTDLGYFVYFKITTYEDLIKRYNIYIANKYMKQVINILNNDSTKKGIQLFSVDNSTFAYYLSNPSRRAAKRSINHINRLFLLKRLKIEDVIINTRIKFVSVPYGSLLNNFQVMLDGAKRTLSLILHSPNDYLNYDENIHNLYLSDLKINESKRNVINQKEFRISLSPIFSTIEKEIIGYRLHVKPRDFSVKELSEFASSINKSTEFNKIFASDIFKKLYFTGGRNLANQPFFIYGNIEQLTDYLSIIKFNHDFQLLSFAFILTDYFSTARTKARENSLQELLNVQMFNPNISIYMHLTSELLHYQHFSFSIVKGFVIDSKMLDNAEDKNLLDVHNIVDKLHGYIIAFDTNSISRIEMLKELDITSVEGRVVGESVTDISKIELLVK